MSYAEKRDGKLTGRWCGQVRIAGTTLRRHFETKKAADGYEAYVAATGYEPEHLNDAKLAGPTFKETVTLMRSKKKAGRDPSGARRLDYLVDRLGPLTLSAITTTVLDSLVDDLRKRPAQMAGREKISEATINRYLSAVSGVSTWVRDRDPTVPAPVIPWRDEKGRRIHWFSQDQEDVLVRLMVSEGKTAEALTLRVLCATGMRWGEFAGLKPHQCQPEWILLDDTKTDSPRDIPIDEELARELKAMVVTGTIPKYEPMRTYLKRCVKACGLSPHLVLHSARHGCATRLIKNGTKEAIVQSVLGHKDIRTTMRYVHVQNDDKMKAMKNLYTQRGLSTENDERSTVLPFVKSTG